MEEFILGPHEIARLDCFSIAFAFFLLEFDDLFDQKIINNASSSHLDSDLQSDNIKNAMKQTTWQS